ncbi:carbonic anhydrase-related protein-like isoform X1 [Patiria miniata]|uniref:Carbonic anhydrase n=1 Tax=Patiria miniata TaxID=46514 RepID=A0A914AYQ4_PATMI|nr:carbonic anhydrase-related protein-like isoform X1 [Patiria miniata]
MSFCVHPRRQKVRKRRLQARPAMSTVIRLSVIKNVCAPRIRDLVPGGRSAYKCTAEWGLHFPEARGDCQSPININSRQAVYDSTLNKPSLNADYALCRECEMINTGNTVQISVKYKPDGVMAGLGKSEPPPRSVLTGGPLAPDSSYELAEFTFHWGKEDDRGSEHTVNGKAYPMELHLIHWNSQLYETVEEAMGRDDGIAIVALFIQVGREHVGLRTLTDYLETVQSKGKSISITTPFHPTCLLPDPMLRDFWSYQGSLTTPPCNEKVTWILFRYPLTISHTQMEEFRRLKNYPKGSHPAADDDGFLADNFRPTQPLNDRVVRASFQ